MWLARTTVHKRSLIQKSKKKVNGVDPDETSRLIRICTVCSITKTRLLKYIENVTTKNSFQIKKTDILHISAQNIDCGYLLEPPRRGGSNEYQQSVFEQK